jgi:DNA-binding NtrC family response regulator
MLMAKRQLINVLLIEDDPDYAEFIRVVLMRAKDVQIDLHNAERLSSAFERLGREQYDLIMSDLLLPDSEGIETFLKLRAQYPDIPIIVLTALNDINLALKAMQDGAQDYLIKGEFGGDVLVRAMRYSMERQKLISKLEKSLKEIKTLRGLLPMCAWCKNIRDDKGYWKRVETYIGEHTEAAFTHGICPECLKKMSPETFDKLKRENPEIVESWHGQADQ